MQTHILKDFVDELYQKNLPWRDSWADYLHGHHIYLVAECAESLSLRFWGRIELVIAGSMLHDIADATMCRFDPQHRKESERIARDLCIKTWFSEEEVRIIIDDIMQYHGCRNGELPNTKEGKIMATADAVVHLTSDFYPHALNEKLREWQSLEEIRQWALSKIERDFFVKIFFNEIREEVRGAYEHNKALFSAV